MNFKKINFKKINYFSIFDHDKIQYIQYIELYNKIFSKIDQINHD